MRALLVLATIAALVPACRKRVPPHTVGLALDVGGRGDQSFNDGVLRGLENMAAGLRYTPRGYEPLPDPDYRLLLPPDLRSRPFPHLGIPPPIVLQGKAQEDYEPNLRLLAAQGSDLVVAVGFMMEPATRKVARDNPRTNFLLIDSPVLDEAGGTFLAGAVAGEITRTGKVGFVGGMQLPLIQKFEVGFRAGVSVVNPEAGRNLLVAYTGTFDDERKGIEVGLDLYRRGCDVVFHAAGLDGLGVIKAAQLSGKIVIGVDSDQSHVAPANVVTSMVKHADVVVYESVRDMVQEKFTGGDLVLGLAEGAMGLVPLSVSTFPALRAMGLRDPQDLTAIVIDVQTLQHAVMTGRIPVPATLEELKAFPPPDPAVTGNLRAAKR